MADKKDGSSAFTRGPDWIKEHFNATALPLALRQEIVQRLLNTRQIVPAEGVSHLDIMKSLETPSETAGPRQVLADLVKKGLVVEVKSRTFSTHKPS